MIGAHDLLTRLGFPELESYQQFHGLTIDGSLGPITRRHLGLQRYCNCDKQKVVTPEFSAIDADPIRVNIRRQHFLGMSSESVAGALTAALDSISAVCGANFTQSDRAYSDIHLDAGPIDGAGSALAWSEVGNRNTKPANPIKQMYDTAENWGWGAALPQHIMDLQAVFCHELMHALGILHGGNGLIAPIYNPRIRTPQPGYDITQLVHRYGKRAVMPTLEPSEPPSGIPNAGNGTVYIKLPAGVTPSIDGYRCNKMVDPQDDSGGW